MGRLSSIVAPADPHPQSQCRESQINVTHHQREARTGRWAFVYVRPLCKQGGSRAIFSHYYCLASARESIFVPVKPKVSSSGDQSNSSPGSMGDATSGSRGQMWGCNLQVNHRHQRQIYDEFLFLLTGRTFFYLEGRNNLGGPLRGSGSAGTDPTPGYCRMVTRQPARPCTFSSNEERWEQRAAAQRLCREGQK